MLLAELVSAEVCGTHVLTMCLCWRVGGASCSLLLLLSLAAALLVCESVSCHGGWPCYLTVCEGAGMYAGTGALYVRAYVCTYVCAYICMYVMFNEPIRPA